MNKKEKPFQLEVVSIRMVKDAPLYSDEPINTPQKAARLLGKSICDMDREVVYVINVNTKSIPINCSLVAVGTLTACMVNPREIFKSAFLSNACGIILLHNHPSNFITPSDTDVRLTKQMEEACQLVGLELFDHIIVGSDGERYFSFCEAGMLSRSAKVEPDIAVASPRKVR